MASAMSCRKQSRGLADDVLGGKPEESLSGAIEKHISMVARVLDQDGVGDVVDHRLEEVAGLFQLDFRLALLGDVLVRGHPSAIAYGMVEQMDYAAATGVDAPRDGPATRNA